MSSLLTDTKPLAAGSATIVSYDLALSIPPTTQIGLQSIGKRAIDIVVSLLGLILFAPAFLLIAVAILVETGSSVFFVQKRLGEGARRFNVYKFRSMFRLEEVKGRNQVKDGPTLKMNVDPRVTRVGRILRRTRCLSC